MKTMINLGVNIDHIATIRQARDIWGQCTYLCGLKR